MLITSDLYNHLGHDSFMSWDDNVSLLHGGRIRVSIYRISSEIRTKRDDSDTGMVESSLYKPPRPPARKFIPVLQIKTTSSPSKTLHFQTTNHQPTHNQHNEVHHRHHPHCSGSHRCCRSHSGGGRTRHRHCHLPRCC